MPQWTDDQQQVIDSREKNMLVSAAAGSGKTAVLVERIIQRILDEEKPIDVDRIVVVTRRRQRRCVRGSSWQSTANWKKIPEMCI